MIKFYKKKKKDIEQTRKREKDLNGMFKYLYTLYIIISYSKFNKFII